VSFGSAWSVIRESAVAFAPPRNIRVSEAAENTLMIRQPGGYSGPWSPDETPYMVEPMDTLASRHHEAVCFVGPSRTGKTMGLLDGWLSHCVTNDPGDMLVVQMSREKAREYSKTRVDRAIRNSPKLLEMMSSRGHDDNTHDKLFKNGMWVKIGWPSASQLSSSDYRYVALTDYDRMPADIDGEGSGYTLALKRTQTFLSRGMCLVESSPGFEIEDPKFEPATKHEGPPCSGIVAIYNNSDRRRWYWKCPDCSAYFEAAPGLSLFRTLPPEDELLDMVRTVDLYQLATQHSRIVCPHCGTLIEHKWKSMLNSLATARWVADGQTVTEDGELIGEAPKSNIAGFWLGGVAAAYQNWHSLVLRHLQGLREYAMSGSEKTLKATVNTDQGMPYMPRHLVEVRENSGGQDLADIERYQVPVWARFLIASVDVQGGVKGRFVVHVFAFGEGLESATVDRYDIVRGTRGEDFRVDPAAYPEDWDILNEKVLAATYRIDESRELRVLGTVVDTGGEDGVTANAYAWYQRLRKQGLHHLVRLVKGASTTNENRVWIGTPRDPKTKKPIKTVELWMVDGDSFKDVIDGYRRRKHPGPGFMHIPKWLPQHVREELDAEVRQKNGKWKKIRARNEFLDLFVYALAFCWMLKVQEMDWDKPKDWARPLDANPNVITPEERRAGKEAMRSSGDGINLANWKRR
jgi:phage terminase large subunit GpA-like protein